MFNGWMGEFGWREAAEISNRRYFLYLKKSEIDIFFSSDNILKEKTEGTVYFL
jgi:hypothetical protein